MLEQCTRCSNQRLACSSQAEITDHVHEALNSAAGWKVPCDADVALRYCPFVRFRPFKERRDALSGGLAQISCRFLLDVRNEAFRKATQLIVSDGETIPSSVVWILDLLLL